MTVEAGESKLLLFETFPCPLYKGAHATKSTSRGWGGSQWKPFLSNPTPVELNVKYIKVAINFMRRNMNFDNFPIQTEGSFHTF